MTTMTSRSAIKTAAANYVKAFIAGDDRTADKWKLEWAILKGFARYSREAVLAADYHDLICNDA
jgi:hypothetical protein